jgi:hypothetical protein
MIALPLLLSVTMVWYRCQELGASRGPRVECGRLLVPPRLETRHLAPDAVGIHRVVWAPGDRQISACSKAGPVGRHRLRPTDARAASGAVAA